MAHGMLGSVDLFVCKCGNFAAKTAGAKKDECDPCSYRRRIAAALTTAAKLEKDLPEAIAAQIALTAFLRNAGTVIPAAPAAPAAPEVSNGTPASA